MALVQRNRPTSYLKGQKEKRTKHFLSVMHCISSSFQAREQLRHSHFGEQLSDAYSMQEENLDRIETVICDNEQLATSRTGTKAKSRLQQPSQNFRGSTLSEGSSSNVGPRGIVFGIQQEFMQFKNSLLESRNITDTKQKRKR